MTRILALAAVILAAAWLYVWWAFRYLGNPEPVDDAISYAGGGW